MTGSIVLATDQGLGYLAKDFFDNGIIDKVLIHEHSTRPTHREWYPGSASVSSREALLEECDTLLFFETPFDWKIIPEARAKGIKTILMVMYECTRYPLPYQPDLVLSPSELDKLYYPDSTLVTVPVTANWRLRTKAEVFVHNAGNGGLGGRNGTREILQAMQYVKSPIKLILRSQVPIKVEDPRIDLRIGTFDDIWSEGDVFLFPEKFNGLSLPLQEAYASGMLVMCGDRHPMNLWLPKEPLIPVKSYKTERIAVEFDSAQYDPQEIAKTIDLWYNKDIERFSLLGGQFNINNSWKSLKQNYLNLCTSFPKDLS
jgi:hypothetical protein